MGVMKRLPAVDQEKGSRRSQPLTRQLFSRSKSTRLQFYIWLTSTFLCQKYHLVKKSAVLTMESAVLTMKSAVDVNQAALSYLVDAVDIHLLPFSSRPSVYT